MSLYVLDTDTLSLYQHGHPVLEQRIQEYPLEDLAITVITVEEVLSGWYTLVRQARVAAEIAHAYRRLAGSVRFFNRLRILDYSEAAIARYENLKAMKLKIGAMDLRIAAVTQEHGGTLVTRNLSDFRRVPNLSVENWVD